ncbi:hypothetical protein, partial [Streptomyces sp. NPDC052127]|uniref:hypothetical protein n=1 Tax=Streptomyces sp. NPDC052127 TaxID=3155679 RepID=UPI00343F1377
AAIHRGRTWARPHGLRPPFGRRAGWGERRDQRGRDHATAPAIGVAATRSADGTGGDVMS